MIFAVEKVQNHGVYALQKAIDHFVTHGLEEAAFGDACFPASFKKVYDECPTLRGLSEKVWTRLNQNPTERKTVQRLWGSHNEVEEICCNTRKRIAKASLSTQTQTDLKALFEYLYEDALGTKIVKTELGDIDDHYEQFFGEGIVCPFCGFVGLNVPSEGRSAYDHYLCRQHYLVLTVNFDNLIPICTTCNKSPQKGGQNALRCKKNKRRPAYPPYANASGIRAEMKWTTIPNAANLRGDCTVGFEPIDPAEKRQVSTWDAIFRMTVRSQDRINRGWKDWLKEFFDSKKFNPTPDVDILRDEFRDYGSDQIKRIKFQPLALLKGCFFTYLGGGS